MRDLLRDYADGGATVLLSSHLLHEIEVVADDLVVIGQSPTSGSQSGAMTRAAPAVACRAQTHGGLLPTTGTGPPPPPAFRASACASCAWPPSRATLASLRRPRHRMRRL